jgi:hypothetical protein
MIAGVLAVAARALPAASAAGWVVRVMAVSVMVAIMPGMLALLAWRPRQRFELLELLGFSTGVSFALVQFARGRVPADAVLAVDYREAYEPTLFMPQQVVVWSGAIEGLTGPERIFPEYFEHLERARAASLEQPLFNTRETREERIDFICDLRVTHVLVNPRLYSMMKLVLARDAALFAPRYDDGMWALYEVTL